MIFSVVWTGGGMTRGNQRDLAREKAAKKNKGKAAPAKDQEGNKGMSMEARKQRDADIMRQKQEAKAKAKAEGADAKGGKGWLPLFYANRLSTQVSSPPPYHLISYVNWTNYLLASSPDFPKFRRTILSVITSTYGLSLLHPRFAFWL